MIPEGVFKSEIVAKFLGEDTSTPELLMPPSVSPDARNIDYQDAAIRKRKGFVRWGDDMLRMGGAVVTSQSNGYVAVECPRPDRTWFLEFYIRFDEFPSAELTLWSSYYTTPFMGVDYDIGFWLKVDPTGADPVFSLRCSSLDGSTPPPTVDSFDSTVALETGTRYRVIVGCYFADSGDSQGDMIISVNGTATTYTSGTIADPGVPDTEHKIGYVECALDDLRLWSLADGTQFWAGDDPHVTRDRELIGAEYSEAELVGYWPLNDYSATATDVTGVKGDDGELVGSGIEWCGALIPSTADAAPLRGLFPYVESNVVDELLVGTPIELWKVASGTLTWIHTFSSAVMANWSMDRFRDKVVICNQQGENWRYDTTNGLAVLTPDVPDVSSTTLTTQAGGLGAGTYQYKFRFVNSDDYTVGESSAIKSVTIGASLDIVIGDMPTTTESGVDKVQVLRTKADGAVFYHDQYVNLGTTPVTDSILDANLVTEEDPYVGKADEAAFCTVHKGSVWLGNVDGEPSRIQYSEPGTLAAHYYQNYVDFGRGDGDQLTAAISVNGQLLVCKNYSLWLLTGQDARAYGAAKLYDGEGCVNHATLSDSARFVYYLSPSGVSRLPLPMGSAPPEDISDGRYRTLFEAAEDSELRAATGHWDPVRGQYWISFESAGEPVTLVFTEATRAWSRRDMSLRCYARIPTSGGAPLLMAGWRGYGVVLDQGESDGVSLWGEDLDNVTGVVASVPNSVSIQVEDTFAGNLAGVDLTVVDSDGNEQTRELMWSNEPVTGESQLTVTEAFDPLPEVGDTWYLGSIDAYWTSPHWNPSGQPGAKFRLMEIRLWFTDAAEEPVTFTYSLDDGPFAEKELTASQRLLIAQFDRYGRELEVRFRNVRPNEPFAVEGYQALYQVVDQ